MEDKFFASLDIDTLSRLADIVCEKELAEITVADGDKVVTVKGKKQVMASPCECSVSGTDTGKTGRTGCFRKCSEVSHCGNILRSTLTGKAALCQGRRYR